MRVRHDAMTVNYRIRLRAPRAIPHRGEMHSLFRPSRTGTLTSDKRDRRRTADAQYPNAGRDPRGSGGNAIGGLPLVGSTVRLWDSTSGQSLAVLRGHTAGIRSVAVSADGQLVASGGWDGAVRLWDSRTRQGLAVLEGPTRGAR
jgi:hypothetical protein